MSQQVFILLEMSLMKCGFLFCVGEKQLYNLLASVQADGVCVNIRQYWLPPNQPEVVITKNGITLRPSEYVKLKDTSFVMGDSVPELS
jgi:hypothetical protein